MNYPEHPGDGHEESEGHGFSRGTIVGIVLVVALLALMVALHLSGVLGESVHS